MKDDKGRALDFEAIRRRKQARRRRRIILLAAGALLLLLAAGAVLFVQVSQVTDESRDFWGNFSASHALRAESGEAE